MVEHALSITWPSNGPAPVVPLSGLTPRGAKLTRELAPIRK
jgi:hypothetical protein